MNKLIATCVLLSSFAACAQEVRAPVNVATRLYSDCLNTKFQTAVEITPTRVGINEFVAAIDEQCLLWMLIWYRPLMGHDFPDGDVSNRFNANRVRILQTITVAIRKEALR